jgi:exodeoxyribonuclease VII large subunit
MLERGLPTVTVLGELSNVKLHSSGHLYYTLKDEASQISGVMWRSRVGGLSFQPADGMKVLVSGRVTVYEVRGVYQLDATAMRPAGAGELQMAFEALKRKLAAEGLFDQSRKRPIPRIPAAIGVVTSTAGAVLHDIVTVLRRRFPPATVIVRPAKVQGDGAAEDIVKAVGELNACGGVDVIIVARGGGSLEDLWAFNEESVARAIAASRLPVVSAVGHETDVTIADFVADLRAPTPSAAAEMVVPDRREILEIVRDSWYSIATSMHDGLTVRRDTIRHLLQSYAFNRPVDTLRQSSQRIDELTRSLARVGSHYLALTGARVEGLRDRIAALDPSLALKRGYVMVLRGGSIVGSSRVLGAGDSVDLRFHDGTVHSTVTGSDRR